MKIRLTNNTLVRFAKDTILEVSQEEGARLISFNNAVLVEEKKKAEAKPTKKK